VLQREIQDLVDLGIDLRTGAAFGRDFTLDSLAADGYGAVFMAIGCQKGMPLDCPGGEAEGVIDAVTFLRQVNLQTPPPVGPRVAVIGGGDTAIDSARSALRLGAAEVHLVYRRTRDEMPAHPAEIDEAEVEGVQFHFLAAPKEVQVADGKVVGLVCQLMKLGEFDRGGRRRPEPVEGAEFTLALDTVIPAIGQTIESECAGVATERGKLRTDAETARTSQANVFAGGDATAGPMTVVDAIADGHRAAQAIHSLLSGEPMPAARKRRKTLVTAELMAALEEETEQEKPATESPKIPDAARRGSFSEVELGYSAPVACREASRCLHCDYLLIEEEA
jgi:NADH-quinone oxidoreductase subunit F